MDHKFSGYVTGQCSNIQIEIEKSWRTANIYGIRGMEYGVRNTGYGIRGTEYGVGYTGYGIRGTEYGVRNTEYGIRNRELKLN